MFTHISVPVIFEPPYIYIWAVNRLCGKYDSIKTREFKLTILAQVEITLHEFNEIYDARGTESREAVTVRD